MSRKTAVVGALAVLALALLVSRSAGQALAEPAPPAPATATQAQVVAAARAYLKANAAALGVPRSLHGLRLVQVDRSPLGSHVRFQQTLGGVPIDAATIAVHLSKAGVAYSVTNDYLRNARASEPSPAPAIERAAAATLSRLAVRAITADRIAPKSNLRYVRKGKQLRLAWRTTFGSSRPFGDWLVDVDAHTGQVLSKRDIGLDDTGYVFSVSPSDPGTAPANTCDGSNFASFQALRSLVTLQGLDPSPETKLVGAYADLTAPGLVSTGTLGVGAGLASSAARDYLYNCHQAEFNEVMAYYHVDAAQRYLRSLGFTGASSLRGDPIAIHANFNDCGTGSPAFYSSLNRGLHLGRCSGRYAAQDADVVLHEYGHALLDDAAPWANNFADVKGTFEGLALHEGYGDLVAAAKDRDPCTGEWFGGGTAGTCVRTMLNTKTYADWAGEVHDDSEIWAGAMWDIVIALGNDGDAADRVLQLALLSPPFWDATPTFAESANTMMFVDRLYFGGTSVEEIATAFTNRGMSVDTTPPTTPTVSLSDKTSGSTAATNDPSVNASISASDAGGVFQWFGNSTGTPPTIQSAGWVPGTPVGFNFNPLQADGPRTLYVWAMDRAGQISAAGQDSILLDRVAPGATLDVTASAVNGSTAPVAISGSDTGGSGVDRYCVKDTSSPPAESDACFVTPAPTTGPVSGPDGTKTLYGFTRDVAGNVSAAASDTVLLDTVAPAATLVIGPAATNTNSVAVTVGGNPGTGAPLNGYCVKSSPSVPAAGDACFSGTPPATGTISTAGEGTKTLYAFTRDAAGNVSAAATDTVIYDTTSPTATLNLTLALTNNLTVAFTAGGNDGAGSGINGYCVQESSTPPAAGSACFSGVAPTSRTLTPGDGSRTLYAFTRDTAGNVSSAASDSIVVDTTAPTVSFDIVPGQSSSTTVSVTVSGTDPSGSGVNGYCVKTTSTTPASNDACFNVSAPTSRSVSSGDGVKTLYAFTRDAANNVSAVASDTVLLDTTGPTTTLNVIPLASNSLTVAIEVSGNDGTGSGVTHYCVKDTAAPPPSAHACFVATAPTDATLVTLPLEDGVETVYAWTKDALGTRSVLTASDTFILDRVVPTVSFDITPSLTNSTTVAIALTGNDTGGSGVKGYCVQQSPTPPAANADCFSASSPATATISGGDGTKTLYAFTRDLATNVSLAASDTVTLDATKPAATLIINAGETTADRTVAVTLVGDALGGSAINGYLVTETSTPPAANDGRWQGTAPVEFEITDPGDGVKTLYGWTRDAAGNVSDAGADTIRVDEGAPVVALAVVETASNGQVTLEWTTDDTDIVAYAVTFTGSPPPAGPAWVATAPTTATLPAPDGVKTLYGWARDQANQVSAGAPAARDTVLRDTVAPAVTFGIAPLATNTTTVAITLSATDGGSGVSGYCVRTVNTAPAAGDACFGAAPVTAGLTGADGTKTLYAFARDVAGNVSAAASDSVRLDRVPPTLALSLPAAVRTTAVPLTLSATDVSTPVAYLVSTSPTTPGPGDSRWKTAKPATVTVATGNGRRTVYAWAKDAAGNVSARATSSTVLDTTKPTAKLTVPRVTRTRTLRLTVAGTDNIGVTAYRLSTSAKVPATTTAGWTGKKPSTYQLPPGDGVKKLYLWTRDAAGNISRTAQASVRLDTKAPVAAITQPGSGAKLPRIASVTGTGADPGGSGVRQVYVSLRRQLTATSCAHWDGKKFVTRACNKPIWLKAKGTAKWSLAFPAITTAGKYVVSAYGVDAAGNKQTKLAAGTSVREFTIGAGGASPSIR